ncbi:MAG: hypothetical protein M3Y27_32220 [Acidobacteriota bacterium]|nr:hypothetical protein [Acidobacteriota bacterium]
MLTRRTFLVGLPFAFSTAVAGRRLTKEEDRFLEDLSRRSFQFFWEQADPGTGLVRDRALADNGTPDPRPTASSASTGFGLTGLCIASERGWISRAQARQRILTTLRYYAEEAVHEHGWFYHFVDSATGARRGTTEVSDIDTALLLAGIVTAREYFHDDAEIVRLASAIWDRIDFRWMLNGHPTLLSMHWKPEDGFSKNRWDHHCELGIMYLLGIASATSPLPIESWYAWRRPTVSYAGHTYISGAPPLFVHQYSQAWIDFRNRREKRAPNTNWFDNSVEATLAHRQFCIDLKSQFPGYSENVWGITSSDSAKGYKAWGGPPATRNIDGTVVPCAAGGSLMLAPGICLAALMHMHKEFGERIYKRYGFVDAFHPTNGWTDRDVIGINVGIILLSAENLRSGKVWSWFMRNRQVRHAMSQLFQHR